MGVIATLMFLTVCAFLVGVNGGGPAVHNEVAERARRWFYEYLTGDHGERVMRFRGILDRQAESLQAGVIFPDWGYGCLSMDEEAEEAHWTPFLEHGVEYLRRTYHEPYSQEGEQLVAFLLGIASHMVADELWHSLSGLRDGFMRTLANSTFRGDYGQAHSVLDVGGDFAMAHMNDLGFMRDKWAVPLRDIAAIYERMGIPVGQWRMRACVSRQFYAMEAVKRFGRGLFPTYAAKAPMLTERLDDYVIGGLYSMAAGTTECWHALVDWFVDGNFTKKCLVRDRRHKASGNSVASNRESLGKKQSASMLHQVEHALRESNNYNKYLEFVQHNISSYESNGILYLSTTHSQPTTTATVISDVDALPHRDMSGGRQHAFAAHKKPIKAAGECAELGLLFPKIKQLYTTSAYSGFGTAVATGDFSGSGRTSIAISAPYYRSDPDLGLKASNTKGSPGVVGAVFVLEEQDLEYAMASQDIRDADPVVIQPSNGDEQSSTGSSRTSKFPVFGSSLAVVDFNADGIDDLVVGSSGYGADPAGQVLGRIDVYLGRPGKGLASSPDFTLTSEQLARYTGSSRSVQRIGGFLFGEDVNNDGFVDLLIGAPYNSDTSRDRHAGRMYGYISRASRDVRASRPLMGPPDFMLASPARQPFEWFGFTATAVHMKETNMSMLLVGAPGHSSMAEGSSDEVHSLAGKVYAFAVANTTAAGTVVVQPRFEGLAFAVGKEKTQLGSSIHIWEAGLAAVSDGAAQPPLVLLGSPSEHALAAASHDAAMRVAGPGFPTEPIPARGWQTGEVRILDPQQWPNGTAHSGSGTISGLLATILGTQSPGHFGRALASRGAELWIGEPISESEDGRIYQWHAGTDEPACFFLRNTIGKARLGQAIRSVRRGNNEILVVTAPHDSQFSRLSGSVLLMERPIQ
ncbi:hypothetical protein IW140_001697 [Coemansia sp. RSA 1813]|nr:hypothetical protein EV178_001493 [Coemansia sp. RSA 1646]KAJ1772527.1 hypothetical protein LPJ74_001428 [Coemansia sp. RSA 1843]KAJ2090930.1 hypothetical protein IW138_002334 [Coemansia sp. RSA 986]KAJ2214002.1 hypothetical protein EV179_003357 [Coemansia sp. RSA 487]KAJ2571243.1 hypothetical protein IW140_001697 [Coemansia sp. RSA 1813]